MTPRSNDIDHTIAKLLALIELAPADVSLRLRLLELLHANNRVGDFVMEAMECKSKRDLALDVIWNKICEMGREIDPGNGIFDEVPTTNTQSTQNGCPEDSPSSTKSDSDLDSEQVFDEPQSDQQVTHIDVEYRGPEHRNPAERRVEDRRKIEMAWPEGERRTTTRRGRKRRPDDA